MTCINASTRLWRCEENGGDGRKTEDMGEYRKGWEEMGGRRRKREEREMRRDIKEDDTIDNSGDRELGKRLSDKSHYT